MNLLVATPPFIPSGQGQQYEDQTIPSLPIFCSFEFLFLLRF